MNMISKTDVLESLKKVIDPEIGINIVDVGLIYRVDVKEGEVEIDFTLTSPGCPLADTINNDIITVVQEDHGIKDVVTNLVWNPPWSIEFLSEEARLDLGYPI
jgi:metal-sulfur cluster biosynthetic enzyme